MQHPHHVFFFTYDSNAVDVYNWISKKGQKEFLSLYLYLCFLHVDGHSKGKTETKNNEANTNNTYAKTKHKTGENQNKNGEVDSSKTDHLVPAPGLERGRVMVLVVVVRVM